MDEFIRCLKQLNLSIQAHVQATVPKELRELKNVLSRIKRAQKHHRCKMENGMIGCTRKLNRGEIESK